jgi:hypothetical protein
LESVISKAGLIEFSPLFLCLAAKATGEEEEFLLV